MAAEKTAKDSAQPGSSVSPSDRVAMPAGRTLVSLRSAVLADMAAILRVSAPAVAAGTLVMRDAIAISSCITEFVVAERDGVLVGVIGIGPRRRDLLIYNLSIAHSERLLGIGTALLDRAVSEATRQDVDALIAFAAPTDPWFADRGFRRLAPDEESPARRRLRAPGRRSSLYERRVK